MPSTSPSDTLIRAKRLLLSSVISGTLFAPVLTSAALANPFEVPKKDDYATRVRICREYRNNSVNNPYEWCMRNYSLIMQARRYQNREIAKSGGVAGYMADIAKLWNQVYGSNQNSTAKPQKQSPNTSNQKNLITQSKQFGDRGYESLMSGDYQKAIAFYDKALATSDQHTSASRYYNERAIAKTNTGDIQGAIGDTRRATELDPRSEILRLNLAKLYWNIKDYPKTLEQALIVLNNNSGSAKANTWVGYAYYQLYKFNQAIWHLDKAIEINPTPNGKGMEENGVLYRVRGESKLLGRIDYDSGCNDLRIAKNYGEEDAKAGLSRWRCPKD